ADDNDLWSFFKPLSPGLWLALFGTSAALGVLLLLAELPCPQLARSPQGAMAKAANMQWATLGLLVRGAVQYTTALSCDLFITGDTVLPVDLGFAFPNDVPDSYLAAFDSALAALDDSGVMNSLQRQFIRPRSTCHASNSLAANLMLPQVKFGHVAGLWSLPSMHRQPDAPSNHAVVGSVHGSSQSNGAPGPRKSLGRLTTSLSAVSGSLKDASTSCICCLPNLGPAAVSNPTSWLGMADAATADEAMQLGGMD
ncbi:hypothetical protein HaLaN_13649, partial [Haematococcus lacustris]